MGRYYTGTEAQFVDDAMFKLPYELMGSALMAKDKEYNTTKSEAIKLADILEINPYHVDKDAAKVIKNKYETQIQDLVTKIGSDKINASRYIPDVEALQRTLKTDVASGDIYNINLRNKEIMKEREEKAKQFKEKPDQFGWTSLDEAYAQIDKKYSEKGGYKDPLTNEYNMAPTLEMAGRDAMPKIIDDVVSNLFGKDKTLKLGGPEGLFRKVVTEQKWEGFSEKDIKDAVYNNIMADDNKLKSYRQQLELKGLDPNQEGLLPAFVNEEVNKGMAYAKNAYEKERVYYSRETSNTALGDKVAEDKYIQSFSPEVVSTSVGANPTFLESEVSYKNSVTPIVQAPANMVKELKAQFTKFNPGKSAEKLTVSQLINSTYTNADDRQNMLNKYETFVESAGAAKAKLAWVEQQKANGLSWDVIKGQRFVASTQTSMQHELEPQALKAYGTTVQNVGVAIPISYGALDMQLTQEVRVPTTQTKDGVKSTTYPTRKLPIIFISPTTKKYGFKYENVKDGERVKLKDGKEAVIRKVASDVAPMAGLAKFGINTFEDQVTKTAYTIDEKTGELVKGSSLTEGKSQNKLSYNTGAISLYANKNANNGMPYSEMTATIGNNIVRVQSPINKDVANSVIPKGFEQYEQNNAAQIKLDHLLDLNGANITSGTLGTKLEGMVIPSGSKISLNGKPVSIQTDSQGYIIINNNKQTASSAIGKKLLLDYFRKNGAN